MTPTATATRPLPSAGERRAEPSTSPPGVVRFVKIDPRRVLAVDGTGRPGAPAFQAAIAALYGVAYVLHFILKRRGVNARVGPLEGLWWTPDEIPADATMPSADEVLDQPWTLLIGVPTEADEVEIVRALDDARRKRPSAELDRLRLRTFAEGRCAEILHVGPYSAEAPTIRSLHAAMHAAGFAPRGRHHEIYLGDPRRTAPERLRTLIRQPVG
jgi:hypothetical protein